MAIDENHPAVRRLVEKIVAERTREAVASALSHLLDGVGDDPPLGSVAIPDPDDAVEYARFEGWLEGMKQGHQGLLHLIRYRLNAS